MDKFSEDADLTNQSIDKFEEIFEARFNHLENLITTRLPVRPAEPPTAPEDDYMDSTSASIKQHHRNSISNKSQPEKATHSNHPPKQPAQLTGKKQTKNRHV